MEESWDVNLVTFFGDVIIKKTSLKWRHNGFFKARFRNNQFERPQFGQIMQPNGRLKGALEALINFSNILF